MISSNERKKLNKYYHKKFQFVSFALILSNQKHPALSVLINNVIWGKNIALSLNVLNAIVLVKCLWNHTFSTNVTFKVIHLRTLKDNMIE